jgi:hypothetical protein
MRRHDHVHVSRQSSEEPSPAEAEGAIRQFLLARSDAFGGWQLPIRNRLGPGRKGKVRPVR